ncbi:glycosyltransferase family 2 protein [Parapedobacter sp. ISTM3]|uniref:Glycosyltransferase involved in cell wall bisynthesis n=1 Tax=Parapedobacter luteus TaxID=623280 RepID=A0A1T5A6R6_9SPHI|nr:MULTISPECIES: glycosyltransferase family 2 protein [Parapedobacter]MBK1442221.1 glycosyltransferase family 2 protein [Parapedobacter sp. ISTM3]SKB30684.1 Glycosyltransferase involved in cell wall bisynthesis [Parapedobacter luteus]
MHKQKRSPTISIITPVWNGLPYIRECVDSVLMQEFDSWELLISDNGSTDGTRAYLDTLDDERIRVFKQPTNLGIMGNLNFLFEQAQAPISQILCADDYFIHSKSLGQIVQFWDGRPAVGFACFTDELPSDSRITKLKNKFLPEVITPEMANLWFFVFGNFVGNLSNISVRTRLIADKGYFDQGLPTVGDFEFWLRASESVAIGFQKVPIVYVRQHNGTATHYMNRKCEALREKITVYELLIDRLTPSIEKRSLVNYFNQEVCASFYRTGIRSMLHGQFAFIRTFINTRGSIVWPKWRMLFEGLIYVFFNRKQELTYRSALRILRVQSRTPLEK